MSQLEQMIKEVLDDSNTVIVYKNDPDYQTAIKYKDAIIMNCDRPSK